MAKSKLKPSVPSYWDDLSSEDRTDTIRSLCENIDKETVTDLIASHFWTSGLGFVQKRALTRAMVDHINETKDEDLLSEVLFGADKQGWSEMVKTALVETSINEPTSLFAWECFVTNKRFDYFQNRDHFIFTQNKVDGDQLVQVFANCQQDTVNCLATGFIKCCYSDYIEIVGAQKIFDYFASNPSSLKALLEAETVFALSWDDPLKSQIEALRNQQQKEALQENLAETIHQKPHASLMGKKM